MSDTQGPGAVCSSWWHRTFGNDDGVARMTRARLRRCGTPLEALTVDAVHDLNAQLKEAGYRPKADQLALVSIALVHVAIHVTEDVKAKPKLMLAEVFGKDRAQGKSKDALPTLSALRFQILMRTTDRAALITPLRRAMAIVRHVPVNVHVHALATDLYYWSEEVRRKWCFQYFGASNATPEHIPEETDA